MAEIICKLNSQFLIRDLTLFPSRRKRAFGVRFHDSSGMIKGNGCKHSHTLSKQINNGQNPSTNAFPYTSSRYLRPHAKLIFKRACNCAEASCDRRTNGNHQIRTRMQHGGRLQKDEPKIRAALGIPGSPCFKGRGSVMISSGRQLNTRVNQRKVPVDPLNLR